MDHATAQIYVKAIAKALVCGDTDEANMWSDVVATCYGDHEATDVIVAAYTYL